MHRCDLTGISCEGREMLKFPGRAPMWIAPTVKLLLIQGLTLTEVREKIKKFEGDIESMTHEELAIHFEGVKI